MKKQIYKKELKETIDLALSLADGITLKNMFTEYDKRQNLIDRLRAIRMYIEINEIEINKIEINEITYPYTYNIFSVHYLNLKKVTGIKFPPEQSTGVEYSNDIIQVFNKFSTNISSDERFLIIREYRDEFYDIYDEGGIDDYIDTSNKEIVEIKDVYYYYKFLIYYDANIKLVSDKLKKDLSQKKYDVKFNINDFVKFVDMVFMLKYGIGALKKHELSCRCC